VRPLAAPSAAAADSKSAIPFPPRSPRRDTLDPGSTTPGSPSRSAPKCRAPRFPRP